MRYRGILLLTLGLASCSTASVTHTQSQEAPAPELQNASMDSVVQFLLTAAATDFMPTARLPTFVMCGLGTV